MTASADNSRILLGVTGGIAAYKACELASLLTKRGNSVRVVMTRAARSFVGPLTFAALTDNPVATDEQLFDPASEAQIGHIELARWAQAVVVAPATANFIAKAACGIADDLLCTVLLATRAPLLVAPAMNPRMFAHPTLTENLARLTGRGVRVVGPAVGRTACGEDDGPGRMSEPAEIAEQVLAMLSRQDLAGVRLLVTAGPTREHLDPVRYISNPSSGRMGMEVARVAARRGAQVVLVLGPTHLPPPPGVETVRCTSAADMERAVLQRAPDMQVIVKAAAVGDFTPSDCAPQKVKKSGLKEETCRLVGTTDILAALGSAKTGGQVLVGFAAETENLLENALDKLRRKNLDMLVANDVSAPDAGFAVETNRVHFCHADGSTHQLPLMSKEEVADKLLDQVAELLARQRDRA